MDRAAGQESPSGRLLERCNLGWLAPDWKGVPWTAGASTRSRSSTVRHSWPPSGGGQGKSGAGGSGSRRCALQVRLTRRAVSRSAAGGAATRVARRGTAAFMGTSAKRTRQPGAAARARPHPPRVPQLQFGHGGELGPGRVADRHQHALDRLRRDDVRTLFVLAGVERDDAEATRRPLHLHLPEAGHAVGARAPHEPQPPCPPARRHDREGFPAAFPHPLQRRAEQLRPFATVRDSPPSSQERALQRRVRVLVPDSPRQRPPVAGVQAACLPQAGRTWRW